MNRIKRSGNTITIKYKSGEYDVQSEVKYNCWIKLQSTECCLYVPHPDRFKERRVWNYKGSNSNYKGLNYVDVPIGYEYYKQQAKLKNISIDLSKIADSNKLRK